MRPPQLEKVRVFLALVPALSPVDTAESPENALAGSLLRCVSQTTASWGAFALHPDTRLKHNQGKRNLIKAPLYREVRQGLSDAMGQSLLTRIQAPRGAPLLGTPKSPGAVTTLLPGPGELPPGRPCSVEVGDGSS